MRLALLVAALCLAGCDQPANDPNICGSLPARADSPASTADHQYRVMIGCIDHWAARLSRSPDSAEAVARAVIEGACDDAIAMYAVFNNEQRPNETVSADALADAYRGEALFRVIQWRAGDCKLAEE